VAPHRFIRNIMQMLKLLSPDPPPGTEPKLISADDAEQIKTTAVVMQWGMGLYILAVVIMWVGLANGGRPG
jgi:hypothetical protein